jgi:two-component system, NarL family, response regulator NreC
MKGAYAFTPRAYSARSRLAPARSRFLRGGLRIAVIIPGLGENVSPTKTVTISDDHRLLRIGLRAVLEQEPDFRVVGEADTVRSTLELVRACRPHVAIVDLNMPDGSGLSAVPAIRAESPETRLLVLTMHVEPEIVRRSVAAGVHGYINKAAELDEVVRAVRTVACGRSVLGVPLNEAGLDQLLAVEAANANSPWTSALEAKPLSERERQVLVLFARGGTHRQIANQLGVSTKTVETYRSRLGHKFGARSRGDLIQCALALGLLEPNETSAAT